MTARLSVLLALSLGALHLTSCAPTKALSPPAVLQPAGKGIWTAQAGNFHVDLMLRSGENRIEGHPPSRYAVTYRGPKGEQRLEMETLQRLETESQYTTEYFADSYLGKSRPVQAVVSDNGEALVIDEQIPNDCCATNNYTYIAPDAQGWLTATYFSLDALLKPKGDWETGQLPRVTGIHGHKISYRYRDGTTGAVKVSALKKIDHPVPPG